jgi:hypothetical protein
LMPTLSTHGVTEHLPVANIAQISMSSAGSRLQAHERRVCL